MPKNKDRRRKLTDEEKAEVRELYGKVSQRKLAAAYGVSRRLITFIGDEEKYERNKLMREERGGWAQYYNRKKHAKAMKEHRKYKYEVMKDEWC